MDWLRRHDGAGTTAERKYKELRAAWERRMFGRAARWVWFGLFILLLVVLALPGDWRTSGTAVVFGLGVAWLAIREMAAPDHIQRWQRGAWGERWTAKELRPLKRDGWAICHDMANGYGNRDHVVAGPAVYVLDTKNLQDDLTIEGRVLRVRRIDQPRDSYVLDKLTDSMLTAAKSLHRDIREATGERVWVYPVVVLWGRFEVEQAEVDGVYFVHGSKIRQWLRDRPVDLHNRRRQVVAEWVTRARSANRRERRAAPPAAGDATVG